MRSGRSSAWIQLILSMVLLTGISGCALGVMAGKMFFGDPKQTCVFRQVTDVDLTKGEHKLLMVCSTPHSLQSQYPTLQIDLVDRISLALESRSINIISGDEVAAWYDDHGSWGNYDELAKEFDADYLALVNIKFFTERVENSETLLQGTCSGEVSIFEVKSTGLADKAIHPFNIMYPTTHPIPRDLKSEDLFQEAFKERIAVQLSQFFYDHRASETVH
ncbi:MAG: hypothetical protein KDA96_11230 [Planctomycetaceae bacterium]|nr:hypothetical protein [Planctomycetaceae bacterium]